MADPVLTRIVNTIKTRLAAFFNDAGEVVVARDGRPVNAENTTIVVHQLPTTPSPAHNRMGNPRSIGLSVAIHVHQFIQLDIENSETEEDYLARCNEAASELIDLITLPASGSRVLWHTLDGNALMTSIGAMRYIPTDAGIRPGIILPLLVTFRVSEIDHTEARN